VDWIGKAPVPHPTVCFLMETIFWRNTGFESDASRRGFEIQVLISLHLAVSA